MNCKIWRSSIPAAVLGLFATAANAAEPGFYMTASVGMADENPKSAGINVGVPPGIIHAEPESVDVNAGDLAWGIGLGYRVNKYLAAEMEYIDFGTTDVAEHYDIEPAGSPFPFPVLINLQYSSHVTGPALSLLGTLPLGENFELFLRGGALLGSRDFTQGAGALDEKFARTVWLAGAGVTWSFAKRWAIRAEYQRTDELDASFVSGETRLTRMSLSALFKL